MDRIDNKRRVALSITNIIVSDLEATATINLKGSVSDSLKIDTVELTGVLYKMIDACKSSFENNDLIYIPDPKIKRTGPSGHYRVWTEEEKQRANETRKKKAMIANLTKGNSEKIEKSMDSIAGQHSKTRKSSKA
jgi:hypothetical protein